MFLLSSLNLTPLLLQSHTKHVFQNSKDARKRHAPSVRFCLCQLLLPDEYGRGDGPCYALNQLTSSAGLPAPEPPFVFAGAVSDLQVCL